MIIRYLLASSGALCLGSMGAFFLYVPALSIVTVVGMLVGLMLMFWLGVQVGLAGGSHLIALRSIRNALRRLWRKLRSEADAVPQF